MARTVTTASARTASDAATVSRRGLVCAAAGIAAATMGATALVGAARATEADTATEGENVTKSNAEQAPAARTFRFDASWLGEAPQIDDADIAETIECQIAVVGCGHAGSALTRRAAELGADVVAIETQGEDGFAAFGSDLGHLNSAWQAQQGIPEFDTTEYIGLFQTLSAGRAQPKLIHDYATRSGEMFDWLLQVLSDEQIAQIKTCNWPVADEYVWEKGVMRAYPGTAKMNTDEVNTTVLLTAQHDAAVAAGARILFETRGVCLVRQDGRVTGVIAQRADGSYIKIMGSTGVVLAAGDYAGDPAMFTALVGEAAELNPGCDLMGFGRDGSGVKMGLWAGATMEPGSRSAMGGNVASPSSPVAGASLWLNARGERYCNEGFAHPFIAGVAGARQPFGNMYALFDANWQTMPRAQLTGHGDPMFYDDAFCAGIAETLDAAVAAGDEGFSVATPMAAYTVYAADTVEQLAERIGLDSAQLAATVARYNDQCAAGVDDDFAKPAELLFPVEQAPFFASVSAHEPGGRILVTLGGLFVDGQHRCLGDDFEPIAGLYAVGNCSGGRFPLQYSAPNHGASLGMANTLGYVLGEQLAQA